MNDSAKFYIIVVYIFLLCKILLAFCSYYGSKSLKVAVSYHLVARTQSCMGEFRGALQNEKETYSIYKQQVIIPFYIFTFLNFYFKLLIL